jgi:hypothetical protein
MHACTIYVFLTSTLNARRFLYLQGSQQQSLQAHKQFLNSNGKLAPTSVKQPQETCIALPTISYLYSTFSGLDIGL